MDGKDPFGYPISQYLGVLAVACIAGLIKHLNTLSTGQFRIARLVIDVLTAGFTGIMMFWVCESLGVDGPKAALMIAIGGLMGNRAWAELENFVKNRVFGARAVTSIPSVGSGTPPVSPAPVIVEETTTNNEANP